MQDFLNALNWFAVGAVIGYCWHPVWAVAKKIVTEAAKARREWRQ